MVLRDIGKPSFSIANMAIYGEGVKYIIPTEMTRKQQVLVAIRAAGSENDQRAFMRLYVENRVSFTAAREAFELGRRMGAATPEREG